MRDQHAPTSDPSLGFEPEGLLEELLAQCLDLELESLRRRFLQPEFIYRQGASEPDPLPAERHYASVHGNIDPDSGTYRSVFLILLPRRYLTSQGPHS